MLTSSPDSASPPLQTLSGHLQQKGAELTGLQEQSRLVERRHAAELDGLRGSLQAASEELRQMGGSLDSTREEKFALQAQVTELRAALQTSSTQVKVSGETLIPGASDCAAV